MDDATIAHNTLSADAAHVQVFYPFHPLHGYRLRVIRKPKRSDGAVSVLDPVGKRLKIPVWMLSSAAANIVTTEQALLSREALLNLTSLLTHSTVNGIHDTFRKRPWTGAREVIVLQLLLLSQNRIEEELVPVEVTVRTELVGLMARMLATVFQTEVRRTDERVSIQSQDQAGTPGS